MTGARLAAAIALAIGVAALAWVVVDRLFFAPGRARADVATATAGATVATGREGAAQDATRIVERYHDRTTEIRTIQSAGIAAVAAASDPVAGGAAARRAICLLDPARQLSDPACKLLQTGAGIGKAPGAGVAAPGR